METQSKGRVLLLESLSANTAPMERSGFEVSSVALEGEALKLADKVAFDVVVVDLDLPLRDGVALVRQLRERGTSVVWLTSNISNDLAATAVEIGVVQVLTKSEDSHALERVVVAGVAHNRKEKAIHRIKPEPNLTALSHEFDELVARMQTPQARAAARALFTDVSYSFGDAAVAGAKKRG